MPPRDSAVVELSVWDIKTKNEFKKCHLPWNHFYVSWDGYMTPCCAKPFPKELNFGNVFDTSLMGMPLTVQATGNSGRCGTGTKLPIFAKMSRSRF